MCREVVVSLFDCNEIRRSKVGGGNETKGVNEEGGRAVSFVEVKREEVLAPFQTVWSFLVVKKHLS